MALNFLSEVDTSSTGDDVPAAWAKAVTNFALLDDLLHGFRRRSKFAYKDADEIYINPGVYFHEGTTDQMLYWNSQLTFQLGSGGSNASSEDLGASEWHYIYLDDSAIVTAGVNLITNAQIVNNTTAPTWSASKHAWYNGNDRCIFAIYSSSGSNVTEFYHDGDLVQWATVITATLNNGQNITATFTDAVAFTMPAFSVRAQIAANIQWVDGTAILHVRTNGSSGTGVYCGLVTTADTDANCDVQVDIITDSSHLVEWKDDNNTASLFTLNEQGWYLPEAI